MSSSAELTYAQEREANIARNKKLLEALDLEGAMNAIAATVPKPKVNAKPKVNKRKSDVLSENDSPSEPAAKSARVLDASEQDTPSSVRRSGRNAGKKVDYKSEQQGGRVMPLASVKSGVRKVSDGERLREPRNKRQHNPKQYGHIPGVSVGDCWDGREGASLDAVHAPLVAGITCGPQGSYSISLNGGYDDDVDMGYAFTYTGSGGRDLKGTKTKRKNLRTAPQSSDQSFDDPFNAALQRSVKTKRPVRVIRGPKSSSIWGPSQGYRYDGLYTVEKAWIEKGLNPKGYRVCKFAFKRLPGQAPLVRYDPNAAIVDGQVHEQTEDNLEEV